MGAAIGVQIQPNVAVELEVARRSATSQFTFTEIDELFDSRSSVESEIDVVSNAVMVNALYSFPPLGPQERFRPYAGAGIGGATAAFDGDETDIRFAYQVIAGTAYDIREQWSLYGEARWFSMDQGEFYSDEFFDLSSAISSIDLIAGIRVRF